MKILLDHCMDRRAGRLFDGHEVSHTSRIGMGQFTNGHLIAAAAAEGFDVLVTVDQNLRREQNLQDLPIAVLELNTRDSRLPALAEMAIYFDDALAATRSHRFVCLRQNGRVEALAASGR